MNIPALPLQTGEDEEGQTFEIVFSAKGWASPPTLHNRAAQGLDVRHLPSPSPCGRGEVFSLDIPFYRTPPARRTATGHGGLAHPLRHPAEAAPPFAVFEGWELGISGAKLLQKDRSIRVQGNEIIYLTLGPWTKPVQILVKPPAHLVFG